MAEGHGFLLWLTATVVLGYAPVATPLLEGT